MTNAAAPRPDSKIATLRSSLKRFLNTPCNKKPQHTAIGSETNSATAREMAELRGGMAEFKGQTIESFAALDAKVDTSAAQNLKLMMLAQLTSTEMLGGYVTAVLG